MINGILWRLHTAAPWRDIPGRYGPWRSADSRFRRWRRDGTWAKVLTQLLGEQEHQGRLGHALRFVDATIVRASRAAGGVKKDPDIVPSLGGPGPAQLKEPPRHALGYSRGGFGTKINLPITGRGVMLGIYVTPGQQHASTAFRPLMRRVLRRRRPGRAYWPAKLAADKGWSYTHIQRWLRRPHIEPVIPTRKNPPREEGFDKAAYRQRNLGCWGTARA